MEEAIGFYEEDVEAASKLLGTGFKAIDKVYPNLNRGDLIVIGGLPGVGKTALALDILKNITVDQGIPAVYMSYETPLKLTLNRLFKKCCPPDFDWKNPRAEDWKAIEDKLVKAPLYIDDEPGTEIDKLEESLIDLICKCDARVVCIDYLQLLIDYPRQVTHELRFNNISTTLKNIARSLGITLIVITKLSQKAYSRKGATLEVVNLSGTIEYEADLIMILQQPGQGLYDDYGPYRLNIIKNRHGKTDYIDLKYDERRCSFEEIDLISRTSAMNSDFDFSDEFASEEFKSDEADSTESEQDNDFEFDNNEEF